jgi:predicted permease
MLVTLLAATMAGLAPAFQSLKVNLSDPLKGRRNMSAGGSWLREVLIGTQVALSFVLLFGAGIAVGTVRKISDANPGIESRHMLIVSMQTRDRSVDRQTWPARRRILTGRLEALPGVQSVAYASQRLFDRHSKVVIQIPGQSMREVAMNWVSPNFFTTLGIPIMSGRVFKDGDPTYGNSGCPVVVSQRFAREFWPNADPLGKTLRDFQGNTSEVVGVARDVSMQQLDTPDDPVIYAIWNPVAGPNVHQQFVRFSGDKAAITRTVATTTHEIAPDISVMIRTIQAVIDHTVELIGRLGKLVMLLGAIAVLLAVIGIYGVVSFAVAQHTREIGIRIALGAGKRYIYSAIFGSAGRPVAVGLMAGLGMTVATASALRQALQIAPLAVNVYDPINYAVTAILLVTVALSAMLVPARRAARVDPIDALRCE